MPTFTAAYFTRVGLKVRPATGFTRYSIITASVLPAFDVPGVYFIISVSKYLAVSTFRLLPTVTVALWMASAIEAETVPCSSLPTRQFTSPATWSKPTPCADRVMMPVHMSIVHK